VIAEQGQEEKGARQREVAWTCSEVPGHYSPWSHDKPTNNLPARISKRFCGPLKGGPFQGIVNAPTVFEEFTFRDDKFVMAKWTFETKDQYPAVRAILVGKYGEPTATTNHTVTNLNGAQLEDQLDTWTGPNVIVQLSRFSSDLKTGSATFASRIYYEELMKNDKETKEKARKAF